MTMLSIALVLCCAMVCGTRVYLRRMNVLEIEARAGLREAEVAGEAHSALVGDVSVLASAVRDLCAEVDSLKALSAFRTSR